MCGLLIIYYIGRAWRIFLLAKRYVGDDLRHTVEIGVELRERRLLLQRGCYNAVKD